MPIQADPTSPATQAGVPAFAAPSQGPALAAGPLRLNKARGPWTYMISPAKLLCRNGRILPAPLKAWHEAGFGGNGAAAGRGEGFIAAMESEGFKRINHDAPVVAFGAQHQGQYSTYLKRYEGRSAQGALMVYWADAWERPEQLGHIVTWNHDTDGRDAWLEQQLLAITPELSSVQVRIAVEPLINAARRMLDGDTPRHQRQARELAGHLPADHVPDDLAHLRDDDQAEAPKTATTTRKRGASTKKS